MQAITRLACPWLGQGEPSVTLTQYIIVFGAFNLIIAQVASILARSSLALEAEGSAEPILHASTDRTFFCLGFWQLVVLRGRSLSQSEHKNGAKALPVGLPGKAQMDARAEAGAS